ncbi:MAG: replicative DNA helicase [Firmicutes bacterium]|nr:replicative DNA helicase [Bacillota bacterium]MDD4336464.1 replicative DNA helicase [Bacillota bacterium]MDD4791868.1 replicative DNA helicase [Bacillota bacterium]
MATAGVVGVDRVPPQSLEAEQSTLGSMLLDKEAIATAAEILVAEDFYRDAHRIIFDALISLFNKGEPADLITVTEALRQRNALEDVGGASYISTLANTVPTSANCEYYARIVKNKSTMRALVAAGSQIASIGYDQTSDVGESLDKAEQLIFRISQRGETGTVSDMKTVLMSTFDRIERLYTTKGAITGLSTGFAEVDNMLSGLQPSELIVIAGRPSMGKTAFALNIAEHVGATEGKPVLIFSLEMSREQLAQRMLCSQATVDGQRLRRGNLLEADWERLSHAIGRLSEAPIFIDDSPSATALDIRTRARRLKAEQGLSLIIIDYLQLVQGHARSENRNQEIAEITRSLKTLARELQVPVVSLAQLSRAVEATADKRPLLSHLRESGEIEQSADVVAFIYREDYYKPDTERRNIAEIIIAKQRNGPTGTIELAWQREYTRFRNLERFAQGESA